MSMSVAEMKRHLPTLTAKTELVLVGEDEVYQRDGDGWCLLDGGGAQGNLPPARPPRLARGGPPGLRRGDEGPAQSPVNRAGVYPPTGASQTEG